MSGGDTVNVSFALPKQRRQTAEWLRAQAPHVVADVLAVAQTVHDAIQSGACADAAVQQRHASEVRRLRAEHADELDASADACARLKTQLGQLREQLERRDREAHDAHVAASERVAAAVAEVRRSLEEAHAARVGDQEALIAKLRGALDEERQRCARASLDEAARAQRVLDEQRLQWDSTRADEAQAFERRLGDAQLEAATLRQQLAQAALETQSAVNERLRAARAEAADELERAKEAVARQHRDDLAGLRTANDRLTIEVQHAKAQAADEYERRLQQVVERHDEQLRREHARLEATRGEKDALIDELRAEKAALGDAVAAKERALVELHDRQKDALVRSNEEVMRCVRALTGTSADIGKAGENLIATVGAGLEMGALTDTSHRAGCGDFLWQHDVPQAAKPLACLVESKHKKTIERGDLDKFERDVRAGVGQGRINAAILISLRERIPSYPHVGIDMRLGVPTIYASRAEGDALPADVLVRLAFKTMASLWAILSQQIHESTDAVVEGFRAHLEDNFETFGAMQKHIDALVDGANAQLRRANELGAGLHRLIQGAHAIRATHVSLGAPTLADASLIDFWETADGDALLATWRAHRVQLGRHPTREQLAKKSSDAVRAQLDANPKLYDVAKRRMHAEWQERRVEADGPKKRQRAPSSAAAAGDDD